MNSFKPILGELLWLFIAFGLAILICYFIFDWDIRGVVLDPQMADTYLVLSTATIVSPVFLLVAFLLFFIKESRKKFIRKIPNAILLMTGLGLITLLAFLNKTLVMLGTNYGWTAYPPLSMLPESAPEGPKLNPLAAVGTNIVTILQILVTIALLYMAFHWGKGAKESS